ncbi:uncharacterized protein L3040_008378 [Drepanopeziza brunnea f. sp. 'multigermtubi']|uniref:Celp0028 effector like protein n=1 Tax=Marssonina brunnea f. sp. multigermtubi (strain MB_m1) TaxID=1072389 RepID=K1XP60_MARBU|nr:uncharacterized protein MBM_07504 [Drepanopeziza brunnea f. sp. 'multigermtubi' MB_m1]EKD14274.1 hypothetical protein MBM_07504 [Drepanopeziza brunnea f. sp. 'multigermtubi' MB_m1]KAJ5035118.1 hypothetical protein L3040_008378 [Drepanopeziza brunnea f. sp. 'multigermtubi']
MYILSLLSISLAAASSASAAALKPRLLKPDEVIVYGANGRHEVIPRADYHAELARTNTFVGRPRSYETDHHPVVAGPAEARANLDKRDCKEEDILIRYPDQDFLDWDIPMSSAAHATGEGVLQISVTAGYTVSDSVSVSTSTDISFVAEFLSASVGISYTQEWTSEFSTAYQGSIPHGKWGMVVSNPRVYRRSGLLMKGCIGHQTASNWSADQHFSNDQQGLSWVQGSISVCVGDDYPIKRCLGEGYLN